MTINKQQVIAKLDTLLERFGQPCFPVKEVANGKPIGSPEALLEVFVLHYLVNDLDWEEIKQRFEHWLKNNSCNDETYCQLVKDFLADKLNS
ncbi:hypothetical protein KC644_01805 [Candidatus Berkelbacteria bacterium]|nr:hypothetical protein [Candidatus Berkelbacteria bacterium]